MRAPKPTWTPSAPSWPTQPHPARPPPRHAADRAATPKSWLAKFREYLAPEPPWLVSVHMPNGPARTAGI
jgi:hypothetical protein